MTESYLAVAGRIRREVEQIEDVVDRAQAIWADVDPNRPADHRIDAVALNLHGFYAGLERILKTIADRIDQTVPEGGSWRQELLGQMNAELNGVRPPVLSNEARKRLDRYRGFRHVVRNAHAFEFDPEQIDLLVKRLPNTADLVFRDLRAFTDILDRMASTE
ncbi:hypothetical protein [Salinibacter ruber]|uniref:HepT-like domain-containing protein n=1 Tax=Salinibacter ruber TaxID=146919 RepID=A0AAW5P7N4_9BACT|nr:hypothetical protein [Salinibacter ruber]MCS4157940.1 hypothetical protein [Salinibacter ruber]